MTSLFNVYESIILEDIIEEIKEYVLDIQKTKETIANIRSNSIEESFDHSSRLFEFTTHPSQTSDTLIKQKIREAKHRAFHSFEGKTIEDIEEYAITQGNIIFEECKKRIYSLENAKIPAHAQMTPSLLDHVPLFFTIYDRYNTLPEWKAEEKAEEKNISFAAFLDEHQQDLVYLDERLEAVMTAKKMILSGQSKMYQWIDFDGAKRPDGIMLSIFAELLIDDINQGSRGISEQRFVAENSMFTLSEREYNRKIVSEFHRIDRSIYALTRYLAKQSESSENPVSVAQMEQLKRERERLLRKLVSIKDQGKQRMKEKGELDIVYLSESVHFIPRFDPKFILAVQKSNLGNQLSELSQTQMTYYKTASHIIDQIITINNLSPGTVSQIILAQCVHAEEVITLDMFLLEKVKRWREKKGQYLVVNPLEGVSLCPLLETKASTQEKNVLEMLNSLYSYYGESNFQKKIPEFFFAGSDLSKSMGSSSSFVRTWQSAIAIQKWNIDHKTDIRVKLGSGESTFRQSGFVDPKYKISVFSNILSEDQQHFLRLLFGIHFDSVFSRKTNGILSLFSKHPWLNSITLQSKAREWIMSMGPERLRNQLLEITQVKEKNRKMLLDISPSSYAPSEHILTFVKAENAEYESIIGSEEDISKEAVSLPALLELFATEITPVLRDRSLKREGFLEENNANILLKKITSSPQINARAISANTASNVIFPLSLVGKADGILSVPEEFREGVILSFESFDILQDIRYFSMISDLVFKILQENGFKNVSEILEKEWEKILSITPILIKSLIKSSYPLLYSIEEGKQSQIIECFEPNLRALYSISKKDEKIFWNATTPSLELMRENWEKHASVLLSKACQFLSGNSQKYPFTKEDIQQWDIFLTIYCKLRGDKGLLG